MHKITWLKAKYSIKPWNRQISEVQVVFTISFFVDNPVFSSSVYSKESLKKKLYYCSYFYWIQSTFFIFSFRSIHQLSQKYCVECRKISIFIFLIFLYYYRGSCHLPPPLFWGRWSFFSFLQKVVCFKFEIFNIYIKNIFILFKTIILILPD